MSFELPGAEDIGEQLARLTQDVLELQDAVEILRGIARSIVQWTVQIFMDYATKSASQWAANATPLVGGAIAFGLSFLDAFITYMTSSAPTVY